MSRGYKLTLLGCLYLAQGLPFGFFTQALPVLLRDAGLSLKSISATSLLFLPWALKFLWAPWVDHFGTPRQWLLPLQLSSALGALLLAFVDIGNSFTLIFAALLLFNLVAAVQDVVTDGLAVRLLNVEERGLANGLQVGAYRLGMILGGGFLLWLFARTGWKTMFFGMGLLLALTALPVLALTDRGTPARTEAPAWRSLAGEWWRRLKQPGLLLFVLLICAYKFGDSMVATLVGPFLRDQGLSKEQIAVLKGTVGSITGLLGAALGAWVAWKLGRRKALLLCGVLQALSLLPYLAAALSLGGLAMLWLAIIGEHLLGGMATVALFTLMMDAADPEHAGTDYTLQASAIILGTGFAQFAGAVVADAFGFSLMIALGTLLSLLGCLLLVNAVDRGRGPPRLQQVWQVRRR